MFLLFNFPVLITYPFFFSFFFYFIFFIFFYNSFGVKEVAEIVSLLILITKLRECIITLRLGGRQMVADGAGTGTGGDGDTGGNRTDVEHKISVDISIPASVGASMTAENGVDV